MGASVQDLQAALDAAHDAKDEDGAIRIANQIAAASSAPAHPPGSITTTHTHYDPTDGMSFGDRALAGFGQSFVDTGHGLKQLYDRVADAVAPRAQTMSGLVTGAPVKSRLQEDQEAEDERRRLDAPLDSTAGGLAGNLAGNVAQWMIPGAGAEAAAAKLGMMGTTGEALNLAQKIYKYGKGVASGAAMGAVGPTGTNDTMAGNTAAGALFGGAGQIGAAGASKIMRAGEDALTSGARKAYEIAQKYNIPMTITDLANSKFMKYLGTHLGEMPGGGGEALNADKRGAFNKALSQISGIDPNTSELDMHALEQGRKDVGKQIGDMAENNNAVIEPQHIAQIQNVQNSLTKATPEVATQVNSYINDMFNKHVPVNNPQPGGPIAIIPGGAWREQNTALTDHVARLGDNDGDLSYRLGKLHDIYMDMMQRGMPPDTFDAFQDLRRKYSNIMTLKPLVKKAPLGEGVNPNLVQGTVNNADKGFLKSGNPTDIGELGQLGKSPLMTSRSPNSGTAVRTAINTGLGTIAGGVLGYEHPQGDMSGRETGIGGAGLGSLAALALSGPAGRLTLNNRLAGKYFGARAPQAIQDYMADVRRVAPIAAVRAGQLPQVAQPPQEQPTEPQMASGGQPEGQKSTFWDLVHQGWKELAGDQAPAQPAQ